MSIPIIRQQHKVRHFLRYGDSSTPDAAAEVAGHSWSDWNSCRPSYCIFQVHQPPLRRIGGYRTSIACTFEAPINAPVRECGPHVRAKVIVPPASINSDSIGRPGGQMKRRRQGRFTPGARDAGDILTAEEGACVSPDRYLRTKIVPDMSHR